MCTNLFEKLLALKEGATSFLPSVIHAVKQHRQINELNIGELMIGDMPTYDSTTDPDATG